MTPSRTWVDRIVVNACRMAVRRRRRVREIPIPDGFDAASNQPGPEAHAEPRGVCKEDLAFDTVWVSPLSTPSRARRTAERVGKTARSAAESAGLAVESADSAKAAAASAQAAVAGAAEAVDRAKEASDLASVAAAQASDAARQVYAEAQDDVERTSEIVREAEALEAEAGDAFRDAQKQDFAKDRE